MSEHAIDCNLDDAKPIQVNTTEDAISESCRTVALAYHSIADYTHASDGFCPMCRNAHEHGQYKNDGYALRFVRDAVVEKLRRDGYEVDSGFDPETGDEVTE